MDSPRDSATAGSTDEFEGLGRVLDRGLIGPDAAARFERLMSNLAAGEVPAPDPEILALIEPAHAAALTNSMSDASH